MSVIELMDEARPEKIFVQGIGYQKVGTSKLHAYLNDLPECDFGFAKEYHVLGVHYAPHHRRFQNR